MSRFGDYLVRFAVILGGYLLACLAGAAMLGVMLFAIGANPPGQNMGNIALPAALAASPFIALFVAYFAFIPSMAVIVLAEWFGWRSWLAYAVGGAFVTLAVSALFASTRADTPAPELLPVMIASGIAAGLVYWMVSGRRAGLWLDRMSAK